LLAVAIAALKPSEAYAWLYTLRRHPFGAMTGAALLLVVAVVTLPITGIGLWIDWLAIETKAGDPSWHYIGAPLSQFVPRALALVVTLSCLVAALLVSSRRAGAWLGLLSILGAPSLHKYELMLLVPAMLRIRRELALVAAILIGTYSVPGVWLGIGIVGLSMLLGQRCGPLIEGDHVSTPPNPIGLQSVAAG
jgi:hypothetical protein